MRTFFTTEKNLIKILHSKDTNVWKKILNLQDAVFISSPLKEWDRKNKTLLAFHRSGKKLYSYNEFFDAINIDPSCILKLSQPTLLLDIKSNKAKTIMDDFGVCCYSINSKDKPFYTSPGWDIEVNAPEVIDKSWRYFFSGLDKCCNSILIIDRYLFSSQWNKCSECPDDNIQDSYDNITCILENILPDSIPNDSLEVSIVFDISTVTSSGRNQRQVPSFQDIATQIEQIRSAIVRPYTYHLELISFQKGCAFYNETHDRFIITNYSITEATHKIKAFNRSGLAIENQMLYFNYSYSRGIAHNDKSTAPARTQDRVISEIKKLLTDANNYPLIQYSKDGIIATYGVGTLQNKLLVKV